MAGTDYLSAINRFDKLTKNKNTTNPMFAGATDLDRQNVAMLMIDNGALNRIQQRQIQESIQKLGKSGNTKNIELLLETAAYLSYGVGGDSPINEYLKDSPIANKKQKENNPWHDQLQKACKSAIALNKSSQKQVFQRMYDSIFNEKRDPDVITVTYYPVDPQIVDNQKRIVKLSGKILDSDLIKNSQDKERVENIKKNLSYFIASSETDYTEKKKCLQLISQFIKPEFGMNSQLKEHKLQILDEMINDITVRTPEQEKLLTKKINQRIHGMCVAISITRKALAHEHKYAYVKSVLQEVNDKPYIKVFDITSPEFSKQVRVPKANVDYNTAMKLRYRIVDAGALNWMHIADFNGNGSVSSTGFSAFDKEHFGMFHDGHYLYNLKGESGKKQNVLRSILKIEEVIEKIDETQQDALTAKEYFDTNKNRLYAGVQAERDKLRQIIRESNVPEQNINKAVAMLLLDKNEQIKHYQIRPKEAKQASIPKMQKLVRDFGGNLSAENSEKLFNQYKSYNDENDKIEKIIKKIKVDKEDHNENLFKYIAFDRTKKEFELDVPAIRDEKYNSLPAKYKTATTDEEKKQQVLKHLENTHQTAPREILDSLYDKFNDLYLYSQDKKDATEEGKNLPKPKELYFTDKEQDVFKLAIQLLKDNRKYLKKEKENILKDIEPELKKAYAKQGQEDGVFWVWDDGSSGLGTSQEIALPEHILGTPHYSESDFEEVAEMMKEGVKSHTSAVHVNDDEFSGHAQYIYDIREMSIKDEKSGEEKKTDVLFFDNTWGDCEYQQNWVDNNGYLRTGYGKNRGGKDGFITTPEGITGWTIPFLTTAKGTFKDVPYNPEIKDDTNLDAYKYSMGTQAILEGEDPEVELESQSLLKDIMKYYKIAENSHQYFENILDGNIEDIEELTSDFSVSFLATMTKLMDKNKNIPTSVINKDIEDILNEIFKNSKKDLLVKGGKEKFVEDLKHNFTYPTVDIINNKSLSNEEKKLQLALLMENKIRKIITPYINPTHKLDKNFTERFRDSGKINYKELMEKIKGKGYFNATSKINSREDYDKLPENIKFTLKKAALMQTTMTSSAMAYQLLKISKTDDDLNEVKALILDKQKESLEDAILRSASIIAAIQQDTGSMLNERVKALEAKYGKNSHLVLFAKNMEAIIEQNTQQPEDLTPEQVIRKLEKLANSYFKEMAKRGNPLPSNMQEDLIELLVETANYNYDTITDNAMEIPAAYRLLINKYNLHSQHEQSDKIEELSNLSKKKLDEFFDSLTEKDFGIKYKDPYDLVKDIQNDKQTVIEDVRDVIFEDAFINVLFSLDSNKYEHEYKNLFNDYFAWEAGEGSLKSSLEKTKHFNEMVLEYTNKNPYYQYLIFSNKIGNIGYEKFLKGESGDSYKLFQIRSSMPMFKAISDKELEKITDMNLTTLEEALKKASKLTKLANLNPNNAEAKAARDELRRAIKILVKAGVMSHYHDEVYGAIKEWQNNIDSPNAENSKAKVKQILMQRAGLHSPSEFFDYMTINLPKLDYSTPEAKIESNQIAYLWEQQLSRMIDKASKADIFFELMAQSKEGRMNAIARNLKEEMTLKNQISNKALTFEDGSIYPTIQHLLRDEDNNNITLKMFLEKMGVSKDYITSVMKKLNLEKLMTYLNKKLMLVIQTEKEYKELNSVYRTTIKSEGEEIISQQDLIKLKTRIFATDKHNVISKDYMSMLSKLEPLVQQKTLTAKMLREEHEKFMLGFDKYPEDFMASLDGFINKLNGRVRELSELKDIAVDTEFEQDVQALESKITETIKNFEKIKAKLRTSFVEKNQASGIVQDKHKVEAETWIKNALKNIDKEVLVNGYLEEIEKLNNPKLNDILVKKLHSSLITELERGLIAGMLIRRDVNKPFIDYLEQEFKKSDKLTNSNTVIVVNGAMALVNKLDEPNITEQETIQTLELLTKLFKNAFDIDLDNDISQALLHYFAESMSIENKNISKLMIEFIKDKNSTLNEKAAVLEIFRRENKLFIAPIIEDIIKNINDCGLSNSDKFLFLQSTAAVLFSKIKSMYYYDFSSTIKHLNDLNIDELYQSAIGEGKKNVRDLTNAKKDLIGTVEYINKLVEEMKKEEDSAKNNAA